MKTITVTIEVYDNSSVEDVERVVSAGLDNNGIDCTYDIKEIVCKERFDIRLHLFWLDKNWKKRGDCVNNYNLIVDMENKSYKVYTNAFYGYYHPEDIEVKKKSDIEDYIEYLKRNGFTEME